MLSVVIDADSHVIETEHTWDYMEPSERKWRPTLVSAKDDSKRQYWLIDGSIQGFRFPTFSEEDLQQLSHVARRNMETPQLAREMADVSLRLKHMDQIGVDVQVLHNTIFIYQLSDRPEVEVALCGSWNRWLADVWKQGQGRLRWSCVLPLLSLSDAFDQLKFAHEHGACAILMRPIEGNRLLHDRYFYPLYEEAQKLDMPIAVHIANANPAMCQLLSPGSFDPTAAFWMFRVPTAAAMHSLIHSEVLGLFPKLRFGFIEASAQWIPWVLHEAARRFEARGQQMPKDIMRQLRLYVTCQNDDDLPYVLQYSGEDTLLIGTDYGHTDPSSEIDAILIFQQRTDISPEVKQKILHDNPKAFYSL